MSQPQPRHAAAVTFDLADLAATERLAARLASIARVGDVIGLSGELGAGKTAFARAFIRSLTAPEEEVPSPTFTLVQVYEGATGPIYHFDLYRVRSAAEAWELGVEEAFASGISLIEWPDRLGPLAPAGMLTLRFDLVVGDGNGARRVEIVAEDGWRERLASLGLGEGARA
ncbi:MAG: tRNA (adenosine(37)-N6)-threonylcarbamoyltransferase complex ATPase subunit type 1 TsaE [Candidatus Eiseniibacteriota bacterium]